MKIESLVRGAVDLFSLPEVYVKLTQVMQHPHASPADLAAVVQEDQGLATRVLRLVNSPIFAFPRRIDSCRSADSSRTRS